MSNEPHIIKNDTRHANRSMYVVYFRNTMVVERLLKICRKVNDKQIIFMSVQCHFLEVCFVFNLSVNVISLKYSLFILKVSFNVMMTFSAFMAVCASVRNV